MATNCFKRKYNFETRVKESSKVKEKYPDRYPIIVYKDKKSTLPEINKTKFLAPGELTIGQFLYIVRKRIELDEKETLFLFINESILATGSETISNIYNDYKDKDGFLYISYCNENVFGTNLKPSLLKMT
jgi:GABA(A) receptor-associated protein